MALVVESVSTVITLQAKPLAITKPTGLAVGEALVAFIYADAGSNNITAPGGWTQVFDAADSDNKSQAAVFWKIADSSDASASDFSFDASVGGTTLMGMLYRVSGQASSSLFTSGVTYTPPGSQSLLFIMAYAGDNDGSSTSWSGYNITGGTNPTWTERMDPSITNASMAVADAIYNVSTAITAFGVNGGAGMDGTGSFFFAIPALQDASGTNALLEVSPTLFSNTGVDVGGTGTNALLEVEPEFFAESGYGGVLPTWNNADKPSTSWSNPDK